MEPLDWEGAQHLQEGCSYRADKRLALMPELNPKSPLEGLSAVIWLAAGAAWTVTGKGIRDRAHYAAVPGVWIKQRPKEQSMWYSVHVEHAGGSREGWLNSVGLIGANLEEIKG